MKTHIRSLGLWAAVALMLAPATAQAITLKEVNTATYEAADARKEGPNPAIVKAQVLLGRRSISPGVIDGYDGDNFRKAVAQFRRIQNIGQGDDFDRKVWQALGAEKADDILTTYKITQQDANYDYVDSIPNDYAKRAKMKRLAYTHPAELLAEKFHMDEDLLKALNPKADFGKAGQDIVVASIKRQKLGRAARVEADKSIGMVVAYGEDGKILASYPATIGSESTPSPSGKVEVKAVAKFPTYHYDPEKNFQQGDNTKPLTIPPGPNNPVGTIWIDLSKPTYGIHGTPEPAKVSKNASHGCVRLTNWDAEQLAGMVRQGTPVTFVD